MYIRGILPNSINHRQSHQNCHHLQRYQARTKGIQSHGLYGLFHPLSLSLLNNSFLFLVC